jgi:hypothetical protein
VSGFGPHRDKGFNLNNNSNLNPIQTNPNNAIENPTSHTSIYMNPKLLFELKLNLGFKGREQNTILNCFISTHDQSKNFEILLFALMQFQGCYKTPPVTRISSPRLRSYL